jgi:HAD superfamily hydrolase (TIGR01549 family)
MQTRKNVAAPSNNSSDARPVAIIFDLFQTLIFFDGSKLPRTMVGEKSRPTTIANLSDRLALYDPALTAGHFLRTIETLSAEISAEKRATGREISSQVRFERALLRATEESSTAARERLTAVADELVEAHMGSLADAVYCPEDRHPLLEGLAANYKMGLLSNFDHGPTAHRMLERLELTRWFATRVVSDDVGLCKPTPEIFALACRELNVAPEQTLFVGDSMSADVKGAAAAGLTPIWIGDASQDPGPAAAVISDVTELPRALRTLGWE